MKYLPLLLVLFFLTGCTSEESSEGKYSDFARCLTNSGAVFYGTDWCSHCKDQKKLFGNAFPDVTFVDCDQDDDSRKRCQGLKIQSYPTWVFSDGSRASGVHSLEDLSRKTTCPLPEPESPAAS